jgi:hypothetical protein
LAAAGGSLFAMWRGRALGLTIALAGALSLGFVAYQSMDRALNDASIYVSGMPGSLLLGLVGIVTIGFGLHRFAAARR